MRGPRGWTTALPPAAVLAISLGLAAAVGCVPSPLAWSPDGRWIAYTLATRPPGEATPAGWMFDAGPVGDPTGPPGTAVGLDYRIWASRTDDGTSVLLEEGRGPLTAPGWSPDGSSLAFGRWLPAEEGRPARYELVVQDAPGRRRVVLSQDLDGPVKADPAGLPGLAVAWSPDGRTLAAPVLKPAGLALVRAEGGRVLKAVDDAYWPAWSPDGSWLAYYRHGELPALECLEVGSGAVRRLTDVPLAVQPPIWTRDGQGLLVARPAGGAGAAVELVRVPIDGGAIGPADRNRKLVLDDDGGRDPGFLGAAFAFDSDGQDLFIAASTAGKPAAIAWYRGPLPMKRFNPLDGASPIGALAVAPGRRLLAARFGPPGLLSPPAIIDPDSEQLTPLAPDAGARAEWLATLVQSARAIVRDQVPKPQLDGRPVERPTLLPAPGEVAANDPAASRLKRLGGLGRALCEPDDPAAGTGWAALRDEARLVFRYLDGDYPGALDALETLERGDSGRRLAADQRLGLLAVRGQIYLGLGDAERARATAAYLGTITPETPGRIEQVGDSLRLTPDPDPRSGWATLLSRRASALDRPPADPAESPLGHDNPDNPDFAPGNPTTLPQVPGRPN